MSGPAATGIGFGRAGSDSLHTHRHAVDAFPTRSTGQLPGSQGDALTPFTRAGSRGRAREAERIIALVRGLSGRGSALVVAGEPGIGKTTLLALARHEAEDHGCLVVAVAGVAAERQLPFGALQRLVHPLAVHLSGLSERQRHALLLAVGDLSSDEAAPGIFPLGLALLELVGRAGRAHPVVLLVDDAQWLDPPTVDVLGFLGRRLSTEGVAIILASREQAIPPALEDLPSLRLGPLDPEEARSVVKTEAPSLSGAQVDHVLEVASGNPLALLELARLTLTGAQLGTAAGAPLTERLERVFGTEAAALPMATRNLLLVMAVADGGDHSDAVAVAARLTGPDRDHGDDGEAIRPALSAGLVTGAQPGFTHPLVRSALVRSAALDDLRRVHSAWADHLVVAEPDRAAWRRAEAAAGPDNGVARALEDAADHAQQRGASETAARWLQRAAEMSEGPACSVRLLRLGELSYRLGRYDEAQAALTSLRTGPLTEAQSDRLLWLQGAFDDDANGGVDQVPSLLAGARRACDRREPGLALQLLDAAARRCWWSGRVAPELARPPTWSGWSSVPGPGPGSWEGWGPRRWWGPTRSWGPRSTWMILGFWWSTPTARRSSGAVKCSLPWIAGLVGRPRGLSRRRC